jgi:hypothetical protein
LLLDLGDRFFEGPSFLIRPLMGQGIKNIRNGDDSGRERKSDLARQLKNRRLTPFQDFAADDL